MTTLDVTEINEMLVYLYIHTMYLNFYVIIATKVLSRTLDRQNVALIFILVIMNSEENISQGIDLYGNILF